MPTSSIKFDPPVIAHRGASNHAPENTLAAFRQAVSVGAGWIEFDVMTCASGEAVVIHDETLERTTNGSGLVADHTFSDLQTLDAGSWFKPQFAKERIPSFKEAIAVVAEQGLSANVEIKSQPGLEAETVRSILLELKQHWPTTVPQPLISSFSMPILQRVREQSADALLGILIHEWFDDWEKLADEWRCVSVNVNHEILDAQMARYIKASGRQLVCYTVNDPARAIALLSWGVDAVFTDNVDIILPALRK